MSQTKHTSNCSPISITTNSSSSNTMKAPSSSRASQERSASFGECPYETASQNSLRRFTYDCKRPNPFALQYIKNFFKPPSEILSNLSIKLNNLFKEISLEEYQLESRKKLKYILEETLAEKWPEYTHEVFPYGSTENDLCSKYSDVDFCISTGNPHLSKICTLAHLLAQKGFTKVVCISSAKVPIVRAWHVDLELACDIHISDSNFFESAAYQNTRMIKAYMGIDRRARPLALLIKHWAKQRELNAAGGATLSSYSWICLVINFLQTRNPPILPILHKIPHFETDKPDWKATEPGYAFCADVESLTWYGSANEESLGELFFEFFGTLATDFDFEHDVASVRHGCLISKVAKGWNIGVNNYFCIEEPFNPTRNLGNTADESNVNGIRQEINRAFLCVLSELELTTIFERYKFTSSATSESIFTNHLMKYPLFMIYNQLENPASPFPSNFPLSMPFYDPIIAGFSPVQHGNLSQSKMMRQQRGDWKHPLSAPLDGSMHNTNNVHQYLYNYIPPMASSMPGSATDSSNSQSQWPSPASLSYNRHQYMPLDSYRYCFVTTPPSNGSLSGSVDNYNMVFPSLKDEEFLHNSKSAGGKRNPYYHNYNPPHTSGNPPMRDQSKTHHSHNHRKYSDYALSSSASQPISFLSEVAAAAAASAAHNKYYQKHAPANPNINKVSNTRANRMSFSSTSTATSNSNTDDLDINYSLNLSPAANLSDCDFSSTLSENMNMAAKPIRPQLNEKPSYAAAAANKQLKVKQSTDCQIRLEGEA